MKKKKGRCLRWAKGRTRCLKRAKAGAKRSSRKSRRSRRSR